jgi:hypothetical protein
VIMDDGHPSPFEPDQLDEVLTAELDGELDAVARDFGVDAEELSARLRATPGVAVRRAALTAARELLAQVPELDELAATRLRNAALLEAAHARADRNDGTRRRGGWLLAAGGIAAAVVAIAGLAFAIGGHTTSDSKASSSPAPLAGRPNSPATTSAPKSTVASLGAFTDERVLAQTAVTLGQARAATTGPLDAGLSQKDEVAPAANSTTTDAAAAHPNSAASGFATSAGPSTTAPKGLASSGVSSSAKSASRTSALCRAPAGVAVSGELVLRATATLHERAVVVLVYAEKNAHKVVIEDTECALLNVQTLP